MMPRTSKRLTVPVVLAVFAVVLLSVCAPGGNVRAAAGQGANEVIVQFSPMTSMAAMGAAASGSDVAVERSVIAASGKGVSFAVYASDSLSVKQLVARFQNQPGVVAVSPNYVRSIDFWPNDPRLSELWGMENAGQTGGTVDADIDAAAAWEVSRGNGAVIACIDTGVDYNHEDLAANMWHNPGEVAGDGVDNDGNGYIDDVYGIDSFAGDNDPMDEHGHGTHASGTMAGVGNNGVGIAGVAWQAKVMALRFLGPGGEGTDAGAVECIDYAVDMKLNHGVNVVAINASWGGGGYDPVLLNAINSAARAGIVFCAAAGNSGLNNDAVPYYPASYSAANMITVGSCTASATRSSFSNYGAASVDLFAPGSSILSTSPGGYAVLSGTSMATPHVTGTVALVAALHPQDSMAIRIDRILLSVERVPVFSGYCATGGRLNAGSAVATVSPVITSLAPASGPAAGGTSVVIRGSGFVGLSGAGGVTFGGTNATSYSVDSATQITAIAPALPPGTVSVQVTSPFGTSADTADDDYRLVTGPTVTRVDPAGGPSAGGTEVLIEGSDFVGTTGDIAVTFGGIAAAHVTLLSQSQIAVTTPPGTAGPVRVQVVAAGGASPEAPGANFTYTSPPLTLYEDTSDWITYTGSWGEYKTPSASSGGYARANTSGSSAVLTFEGDKLDWIATKGITTGKADVSLDGHFQTTVDLAAATAAYQVKVWSTGILHHGIHKVSIRWNSASAAGKYITLDRVEVLGQLVHPVPPPVSRTDMTFADPVFVQTGTWAAYPTASACGSSYLRSNTSRATMVISFNGRQLDWIATKGTTTGKADVYLDNVYRTTIDLAASVVAYQVNVWSTGILPLGYHTVKIVRSASNVSGKYITVDAVDVAGTLVPTSRKEESEPLILWNPAFTSWTTDTSASASGGSYTYINTAGATITIGFTGVSLDLIARKAPSYGKMWVTVDGATSYTVDLYSSASAYKKTVWRSGFLAPGDHTVTITRLGTKNAYSSGYTIDLDAIDLIGELK